VLLLQVLESSRVDPISRREIVVAMQRFSKSRSNSIIPRSYTLEGVQKSSDERLRSGSFGDVLKGHYQNRDVCIKVVRLYQREQSREFFRVSAY
jgi:hypothetical protein